MKKSILVTGGAGYIGSHVVKQLGIRGESIVVLDNLSTGFSDAVLFGEFVEGDVGDCKLVEGIIREYNVGSVMHFAAHTIVPESVSDPLKYYRNNTCATRKLLQSCQQTGIKHFIFSSTAAVYGEPASGIASETTPTSPINPYGTSKLMSEWMIRDLCAATDMEAVILRYFNVAGCDPEGDIGQRTEKATLLIKVACEVATGKRDLLSIFGTDYPTPDGTCIRDYIHVSDLADAHLAALDYLRNGGDSDILNCGYGRGYSVREVICAIEEVEANRLRIHEMPRRAGDPPVLISSADKIRNSLGWTPKYDELKVIVKSALSWERKLAN